MNNESRIDFNSIPDNSWCKMILECYAIWVNSNNDFGIFFRPILISFTLKNIYNYKFIEDDSDSKSDNCNIPDTEIPTNIFIKSKSNNNNNNYNETSQLECNILYNSLIENSTNHTPKLIENDSETTSDNNCSIIKANNSISSNSDNNNYDINSSSSLESLKTS